jgi:nucleotide-binding universal stress UspA family protein
MPAFSTLLVPVDFSAPSLNALRLAVRLASDGGRVHVLHVGFVPGLAAWDLGAYGVPMPESLAHIHDEVQTNRRITLEALVRAEVPDSVRCTTALREGYAPDEIVAELAACGADAVVMGSHGISGAARVLLGSVTERVLAVATVPVIVTR